MRLPGGYMMLTERQVRNIGEALFQKGFYCALDRSATTDAYGITRRDNAVQIVLDELRGVKKP